MATTLQIDEINTPQFDSDEYIKQYFRPMRISKERKTEREEASKDFRDVLLFLFALIAAYSNFPPIDWKYIERQYRKDYERAALRYARNTEALQGYIDEKTRNFIDITQNKDLDDPYWTSEERATMEAVNDANDVVGYEEWQKAIEEGKTYKIWKTEHDNKVRHSHREVDGKKIPITEMFLVGDSLMRFPHDTYYGTPAQTVNCRCSCEYVGSGSKVNKTDEKVQFTNKSISDNIKKKPRLSYDLQFFGDKSDHMWDQMEYRDITDDEIMDAMEYPLADPYDYYEIDEEGRPSIKFIGEKVTVAWNPETETQITCWRTPRYLAKRLKNGSKRRRD